MDLLGPLPKIAHENEQVLDITDRFSKLTRSIPLRTTTASVVANTVLDNWVHVFRAPRYVLTDNGPQCAAKLFDAVCALLGVWHYLKTAYHPQSNGQTVQSHAGAASLAIYRGALARLGRMCAAADLRVQYAGPPVDGDDSVQPGFNAPTVRFNSTWYTDHCS